MTSILDTIVARKRIEIARLPEGAVQAVDIQAALQHRGGVRDFRAALRKPPRGRIALIAEIKKASPSAGVICPNFDPVRLAREYEAAGASCLSVLTDETFFQGSLDDLRQVRAAVSLPLLRKDFIIDERQILEAAAWGADAILLIVAILTDGQLEGLHSLATAAGLATLVEVHDETELRRALAVGASLIGVNNRDLKTFKVELGTTERLAGVLSSLIETRQPLLVAESGIHTRADVQRLANCGARAILVGESLIKAGDVASMTRELLSARGNGPKSQKKERPRII